MPEEYNVDEEIKRIVKEVPEIIHPERETREYIGENYLLNPNIGYINNLKTALIRAKQTLSPDNPFQRVKGTYTFDIDTSGASQEKTEYIHKKVADYLMEQTGKIFTFKPGNNSKIYVLGEDRSYKVSRLLQEAPTEIKKLVTQYPQTKKTKVNIRISTDPLDIVKKSTHQTWESCEMVGGAYCQGIFSDIENNNAIAYIYLDNSPKPAGRFMLRWCNTPEKRADIGIEPIMYPRTSYALIVYELIKGIVESKGYGAYEECTTPYKYSGYSDYIGGSGVIKYHSGSSSEVLIQYATMPDISRNMALALAEHTTPTNVRRALAENDKVCEIEDAVNKLSKDIDDETKINLIATCSGGGYNRERKLTETAINNLINDNENVRLTLAQQIIDVPETTLDKLASDKSLHVRTALARNKFIKCCDNIIEKLANDDIPPVREELVNSQIPLTEKAENLLADNVEFRPDADYEEYLKLHVSEEGKNVAISRDISQVHNRLANKAKYPSTVRKLLDKKDRYVNKELALNKVIVCCDDVIEKLTNDKPEIAVNLLSNSAIDKPTRKKVIENIIEKTSIPPEGNFEGLQQVVNKDTVYMHLAEQPEVCDYPQIIDEVMKNIHREPSVYRDTDQSILYLAANPCLSKRPDIIRKINDNANLHIVQNLAKNPAIEVTPDVVEKLYAKKENPSIQMDLLENPAIMKIQNIKDKLIRRINLFKSRDTEAVSKTFNEPNYLNMTTENVTFRLSKNPKLSTDKELFDKVYKSNAGDVLSYNPDIFEHKDIVDKLIGSKDIISQQVLMTNPAVIKYPEIIDKVMNTTGIDDVQRNLYETISYEMNKISIREARENIPEYVKKAHEKLYYKLYPGQYNYEDVFGWSRV